MLLCSVEVSEFWFTSFITAAPHRYVLGNTKTEDPKHMYYLKRFIAEALKCNDRPTWM